MAKERENVVFLFIIDTSFLNKMTLTAFVDIWGSCESLGQSNLLTAADRASEDNVEAITVIRKGIFCDVLP